MASDSLDDDTLEAIAVLARAVDQVRVPSVLEFRLLSNALRRATDSRGERELDEAARVFQTLDPELRVRIMECATDEARAQAGRAAPLDIPLFSATRTKVPAAVPAAVAAPPRASGSSFLAALNGLRPAPQGSRNAAKDRLTAAVESQRALPDNAVDLGYEGFRPGARLPRSS